MRYFLAFLITILMLVTLIFVLLSGGGGSKSTTTSSSKPLASYANTDAVTSLVIDGPINANSEHQQVRIFVTNKDVTYQSIRGYNGQATNTRHFSNNVNSYSAFLSALSNAGFTKMRTDPSYGNGSGTCPLGNRYYMKFIYENKPLVNSWANGCGAPRTYLGNLNLTLSLFQAQVPGYDFLTVDLTL